MILYGQQSRSRHWHLRLIYLSCCLLFIMAMSICIFPAAVREGLAQQLVLEGLDFVDNEFLILGRIVHITEVFVCR